MASTALVTGGAGFIGSHLVDALVAKGYRVRVLDNLLEQAHPRGSPPWLNPHAELVIGDLRDHGAVDRALAGVEIVFHQGGIVGNGQSMFDIRRYVDINSVGTATLIEALLSRADRIRRFIVASSMVVYGDGAYLCPEHGHVPRVVRPEHRLRACRWEPIRPSRCATSTSMARARRCPTRTPASPRSSPRAC